jgi:hypothetical protein
VEITHRMIISTAEVLGVVDGVLGENNIDELECQCTECRAAYERGQEESKVKA